jgi:hypothetical protein
MAQHKHWRYNEGKILDELEEYLISTYNQHYVDDENEGQQTMDRILHSRRDGFLAGNITKYIDRYHEKGTPKKDLFKVLHYTILLINHLELVKDTNETI